jgi:hypothetical protein
MPPIAPRTPDSTPAPRRVGRKKSGQVAGEEPADAAKRPAGKGSGTAGNGS